MIPIILFAAFVVALFIAIIQTYHHNNGSLIGVVPASQSRRAPETRWTHGPRPPPDPDSSPVLFWWIIMSVALLLIVWRYLPSMKPPCSPTCSLTKMNPNASAFTPNPDLDPLVSNLDHLLFAAEAGQSVTRPRHETIPPPPPRVSTDPTTLEAVVYEAGMDGCEERRNEG